MVDRCHLQFRLTLLVLFLVTLQKAFGAQPQHP